MKSLDPFEVRILGELSIIVFREKEFVPSKSVMYLNNDERASNYDADSCEENGVVVPTNVSNNPNPGRHAQSDHYASQRGDKIRGDDDTSLAVLVSIRRQ